MQISGQFNWWGNLHSCHSLCICRFCIQPRLFSPCFNISSRNCFVRRRQYRRQVALAGRDLLPSLWSAKPVIPGFGSLMLIDMVTKEMYNHAHPCFSSHACSCAVKMFKLKKNKHVFCFTANDLVVFCLILKKSILHVFENQSNRVFLKMKNPVTFFNDVSTEVKKWSRNFKLLYFQRIVLEIWNRMFVNMKWEGYRLRPRVRLVLSKCYMVSLWQHIINIWCGRNLSEIHTLSKRLHKNEK